MEKLITRDFNIQTGLIAAFFIFLCLDLTVFHKGICIMVYFLLAVNHLVSSNIRFFSKNYSKSILFKMYYFISMIFIVSFMLLLVSRFQYKNDFLQYFWSLIIGFGVFGTPILAIVYYFICHNDYEKIKESKKRRL